MIVNDNENMLSTGPLMKTFEQRQLVSQLVGALSPVNHRGLHHEQRQHPTLLSMIYFIACILVYTNIVISHHNTFVTEYSMLHKPNGFYKYSPRKKHPTGLPICSLSSGYLHLLLDMLGGIFTPSSPTQRVSLCVQSFQPFTSHE